MVYTSLFVFIFLHAALASESGFGETDGSAAGRTYRSTQEGKPMKNPMLLDQQQQQNPDKVLNPPLNFALIQALIQQEVTDYLYGQGATGHGKPDPTVNAPGKGPVPSLFGPGSYIGSSGIGKIMQAMGNVPFSSAVGPQADCGNGLGRLSEPPMAYSQQIGPTMRDSELPINSPMNLYPPQFFRSPNGYAYPASQMESNPRYFHIYYDPYWYPRPDHW